jgi:HD-GYP domain-containing protein (c-di-GMP phosphodiesterase class II)
MPILPRKGAPVEDALEVLERFGLALQDASDTRRQVALSLEAARDALGADAVFWHPGRGGEEFSFAGDVPLTAGWAGVFLPRAIAGEDGDRLTRNFLDRGACPTSPWPTSAALVRVSRTRGSWLGALSFHPRRLFGPADLKILLLARRMLLGHRQQLQAHERLRESLFGLVRCLTAAIDAKDPYTSGHSERVARIAARIGGQMGLPPTMLSDLYLAGLLHDIGKIGIRDEVLQKPGRLSEEEFAHIQTHTVIGDRLVAPLKPLQHLRPGVRSHHERWDGKGYPDGLRGEAIPLLARVLAVADSCDAMLATRAYRGAMSPMEIEHVFRLGGNSQWDAEVVASFLACRSEVYAIREQGECHVMAAAVERALDLGGVGSEEAATRPD